MAIFAGGPLDGQYTSRTSRVLYGTGARNTRPVPFIFAARHGLPHGPGYVLDGGVYLWYPEDGFYLLGGPLAGTVTRSSALVLSADGRAVHPKSARAALAGRSPVPRYVRRDRWDDYRWTP